LAYSEACADPMRFTGRWPFWLFASPTIFTWQPDLS
jgi:hypothetical protein